MLADTMRALTSGVANPRVLLEHCINAAIGATRQRLIVVPKVQLGERFVLIGPPTTEPLNGGSTTSAPFAYGGLVHVPTRTDFLRGEGRGPVRQVPSDLNRALEGLASKSTGRPWRWISTASLTNARLAREG